MLTDSVQLIVPTLYIIPTSGNGFPQLGHRVRSAHRSWPRGAGQAGQGTLHRSGLLAQQADCSLLTAPGSNKQMTRGARDRDGMGWMTDRVNK